MSRVNSLPNVAGPTANTIHSMTRIGTYPNAGKTPLEELLKTSSSIDIYTDTDISNAKKSDDNTTAADAAKSILLERHIHYPKQAKVTLENFKKSAETTQDATIKKHAEELVEHAKKLTGYNLVTDSADAGSYFKTLKTLDQTDQKMMAAYLRTKLWEDTRAQLATGNTPESANDAEKFAAAYEKNLKALAEATNDSQAETMLWQSGQSPQLNEAKQLARLQQEADKLDAGIWEFHAKHDDLATQYQNEIYRQTRAFEAASGQPALQEQIEKRINELTENFQKIPKPTVLNPVRLHNEYRKQYDEAKQFLDSIQAQIPGLAKTPLLMTIVEAKKEARFDVEENTLFSQPEEAIKIPMIEPADSSDAASQAIAPLNETIEELNKQLVQLERLETRLAGLNKDGDRNIVEPITKEHTDLLKTIENTNRKISLLLSERANHELIEKHVKDRAQLEAISSVLHAFDKGLCARLEKIEPRDKDKKRDLIPDLSQTKKLTLEKTNDNVYKFSYKEKDPMTGKMVDKKLEWKFDFDETRAMVAEFNRKQFDNWVKEGKVGKPPKPVTLARSGKGTFEINCNNDETRKEFIQFGMQKHQEKLQAQATRGVGVTAESAAEPARATGTPVPTTPLTQPQQPPPQTSSSHQPSS